MDDPHRWSAGSADESSDGAVSREEWEELPSNPDLNEDLGYELFDLEAHETDENEVLIIPTDEDMLRDDAFIVLRKGDLLALRE